MESFAYGIGCAVLYWGHFYHCGVAAVTTINPVYSWTRMTFFLSLIKPLQVESILGAQPFSASVHLRLSAEWMSDGWVHTGCPETGREYQWNVVFLFFFLFFFTSRSWEKSQMPWNRLRFAHCGESQSDLCGVGVFSWLEECLGRSMHISNTVRLEGLDVTVRQYRWNYSYYVSAIIIINSSDKYCTLLCATKKKGN